MFDDQNEPNTTGQSQNNQSPAGPKPIPPAGLPQQAEPTVMPKVSDSPKSMAVDKPIDRVSTPPKSPTSPGVKLPDLSKVNQAEDMFQDTDGVPIEEVPSGAGSPPAGPLKPLTELPDDIATDPGSGGKMTWLIILIILIVLGAGGYYAYSKFFSGLVNKIPEINLKDISPVNINKQFEEDITNLNLSQEKEGQGNENININPDCPQLAPPSPDFCGDGDIVYNEDENGCPTAPDCLAKKSGKDSDKDGLTDEEEEQFGTDPFEPDSDGDNLFDREEVKVWHTNPLNPDSDNDGYLDGDEVDSGYNPLGPGKLLDLNFKE